MKTAKRWLMMLLALTLVLSLAITVSAEETEEGYAPFLSYRHLNQQNDSWYQEDNWMYEEGPSFANGYTGDWGVAAQDCFWHVYYLNTWNESEQKYDATPVLIDVNEYLTAERLMDGDYSFMAGAADPEYYYKITANPDTWGKTGVISYTMDDGTVLKLQCSIQRYEAGFYTADRMRDDTWLHGDFLYNRLTPENNVFYFGFQSTYWTVQEIEPLLGWHNIPEFDGNPDKFFTAEDIGSNMYKITVNPELIALGEAFGLDMRLWLTDPDGNSNNGDWYHGISVWPDHENERRDATIWVNDTPYYFADIDETTRVYAEEPSGIFNGNGDEIHAFRQTSLPTGVSFDLASRTLTLNNCNEDNFLHRLEISYMNGDDLPSSDLTIDLVGENLIACDYDNALLIRDGADVTITGDGSLLVYADNKETQDENGNYYAFNAIQMHHDTSLTIAGNAQVSAMVDGPALETCYDGDTLLGTRPANVSAISGNCGNLTIRDNGFLKTILPEGAKTRGPKAESEDQVFWDDWYPGGFRGISDVENIRIEGGRLETNELEFASVWHDDQFDHAGSYIQTGGSVVITPIGGYGETEKWDDENDQPFYDEEGNPVMIDHYHYGGLGSHEGGYIEITGGTLDIHVAASEEEMASSAYCEAIYLGKHDDSCGELVIKGGTLNLSTNTGRVISVEGSIDISGGTVKASGTNDTVVYAMTSLNVSGGKLEVSASEHGHGINANDCDLNISGGEVVITGSNPLVVGFWYDPNDPHMIDGWNGTLNVSGGKLTINGTDPYSNAIGLWPLGKANFTGGETVINDGMLSCFAPVTISGNAVVTQNNTVWENFNPSAEEETIIPSAVTISENAVVNLNQLRYLGINDYVDLIIDGGQLNINSDQIEDPNHENPEIISIQANATCTINDGAVNIEFTDNFGRLNMRGTYTQNGGTVTLIGEAAQPGSIESYENLFYMDLGSTMNMNGGELTINAKNYRIGLFSNGNYTQKDGTVNITVDNDKDGYIVEGDSITGLYSAIAFAGKGLDVIEGGTLNLNACIGLEQTYDPGDPSVDWPGVEHTKLTVSGGTVNIDANWSGLELGAPVEITGGNVNITASGLENPFANKKVGRSVMIWGNGFTGENASCLNISGGNHQFLSDASEDHSTFGLFASDAPVNITGGTILSQGKFSIYSESPTSNTVGITVADDLNIISLDSGSNKELLSGSFEATWTDENGEPQSQTFYTNIVEEDNDAGNMFTMEGVDCSTKVLITTGQCGDNAYWRMQDGNLIISGTGAMWDNASPWLPAHSCISKVTVEEGITKIGASSFSTLENLTDISYPATLTAIGESSVMSSPKLARYTVASGNTTLKAVDQIAIVNTASKELITVAAATTGDYTVPANVTKIGKYAFYGCSRLTTITVPAAVVAFDADAFTNCGNATIQVYHGSAAESFVKTAGIAFAYIHEYGEATCTAPATCKFCDATTGSALGHSFTGGKCTVCGADDPNYNVPVVNPFTDVKEGEFYYTPVQWALANNITTGLTPTQFGPMQECTRGQVVTFLWRAAGEPEPSSSKNPFKDVKTSDFFYKAVLWAVEEGITAGYGANDIFNPSGICNRGQVATFLHRYAGKPTPGSSRNPFTDVKAGAFYYDAVLWAVEQGITNGYGSDTIFNPDGNCTRGQIVTFLYRAISE